MHLSSSYAKILGETNFRTREIPRSGSKSKDGGEKEEEERTKVGNNNAYALQLPPRVEQASRLGQINFLINHNGCDSKILQPCFTWILKN